MLQVIVGAIGSMAFSMLFNAKSYQVIIAGIGSTVTWSIYLLMQDYAMTTVFISSFVASLFVATYAEIMAKVAKAPATIFLITAALPLIPGGGLYYTMHSIVDKNFNLAAYYGERTLETAIGISVGFLTIAILVKYVRRFMTMINERKKLKHEKE